LSALPAIHVFPVVCKVRGWPGSPRRRDPSAPGLRRVFSPSSPKPTPPKRLRRGTSPAMTR